MIMHQYSDTYGGAPSAAVMEMAEMAGTAVVPEAAVVGAIAPHAGTFFMIPFEIMAVILIIIGIVVYSASSKSKTAGTMFLLLGFSLGIGAFYVSSKNEASLKHA